MGFWTTAAFVAFTTVLVQWIPTLLRKRPSFKEHGFVKSGWEKVAHSFRYNLDIGLEEGASLCVWHEGEVVVDLWGGSADNTADWEIEEDTLFQLFSSTKAIAATTIAMLVDRGHLQYEKPVARYWPEFAQNGKENITVEQLLSHQTGLVVIDEELVLSDMRGNPSKFAASLAKQKPNWPPGEQHGYHIQTFAMYLDQLLQRVDPQHRTLEKFFEDEIKEPFGLDSYIGLPSTDFYRSARIHHSTFPGLELLLNIKLWPSFWAMVFQPDSLLSKAINNPNFQPGIVNNPKWKSYPLASSHGFSTARSLARFYAILANDGTLNGKKLLSKETLQKLVEPIVSGKDVVVLFNNSFSRGFSVQSTVVQPGLPTYGTPGSGGQAGWFDPANDIALAYLTNHHADVDHYDAEKYITLESAVYSCLDDLKRTRA